MIDRAEMDVDKEGSSREGGAAAPFLEKGESNRARTGERGSEVEIKKMRLRRKTTGSDVKVAPVMGLPRRALIKVPPRCTVLFLFLASALLALSSSAIATPDDTDSMTGGIVLPIVARQSVGSSSSSVASRRRLFALREGAANFSLPLEGAIKDYGCV